MNVIMPQLGESVTEGIVARWLKRVGDRVEKYEPLLEVVTDKVTAEVPSPVAGVLRRILVEEGATVPVGATLAVVEEADARVGGDVESPEATPSGVGGWSEAAVEATAPVAETGPTEGGRAGGRPRTVYSPLVQKLAREHGVDLSQVRGTGLGGRITKDDVLAFVAQRGAARADRPSGAERVDLTPMRRSIAQHLSRSVQTIPQAWTMVEVDVTGLVRLRDAQREAFRRREGIDLTYLPFFVRAATRALRAYPIVNAAWAEDHLLLRDRVHVGIAVGLEDGLVVPVVRDADQYDVPALARLIADLVERARTGRLALEDVQGATLTVNNTGAFGSVASRPILPVGQSAILTLERIVRRPVVVGEDAIAVRSLVNVCCTFDHRVLDGLTVGRFLDAVRRHLESYGPDSPLE
ncbi:MAG TPA: dihydrolipoamide acetyltransferase family protein [Chloroflexota bacterium]